MGIFRSILPLFALTVRSPEPSLEASPRFLPERSPNIFLCAFVSLSGPSQFFQAFPQACSEHYPARSPRHSLEHSPACVRHRLCCCIFSNRNVFFLTIVLGMTSIALLITPPRGILRNILQGSLFALLSDTLPRSGDLPDYLVGAPNILFEYSRLFSSVFL